MAVLVNEQIERRCRYDMKEWELAYQDYKDGMKYKEIAEKYGKSINTIKSWKSRYWNDVADTKKKVAHTKQKGCTQNKKVARKKKRLQPVIDNDELTESQKMFCLYYLQSFNATKAYRQTYNSAYTTARTEGSKMLAKPNIKQELHRLKSELQQDVFVDVKDIFNEYTKQAFADITDYTDFGADEYPVLDENGEEVIDDKTGEVKTYKVSHVSLKNSDEVDGTLIQEVKKGKDGVSVKLYDKQKAMQELVKLMPDRSKTSNDWKEALKEVEEGKFGVIDDG